jgi:hypothetical protein
MAMVPTSTINIGAYGGGIEEPYQRTDCGSGVGWANEFETIRMRVEDFLANGSGLDLTDVVAVVFNFGPSWGSSQGRIGLDGIALTQDGPPPAPGSLAIALANPLPDLVAPGDAVTVSCGSVRRHRECRRRYHHAALPRQRWRVPERADDQRQRRSLFEAEIPGVNCGECAGILRVRGRRTQR